VCKNRRIPNGSRPLIAYSKTAPVTKKIYKQVNSQTANGNTGIPI